MRILVKQSTGGLAALFLVAAMALGEAAALEAGAAKVEITPPVGTPLNGYGARLGRSSIEVHDPLWARCLYLNDGKTALFLVSADLCAINPELRARVLELEGGKSGVPAKHIILTATHTHNGHGGMIKALPFRLVSGRFMPEVLEATARGFVQAMRTAYENRMRAALGFGTGSGEGVSKNRMVEGGPVDEQVGVIRVDDSDGHAIAILGNFAAHPTTIADEYLFSISADYPGYFCNALEELAEESTVALFLNGAEGNQRCGNPEKKTGWERTESIGRYLAFRAKQVANAVVCGEAGLHVGYAAPDLPPPLSPSLFPGSTVIHTLEIEVASKGPEKRTLLLTFFPGEPCVELGLELRRRALARGYAAQFSVGLASDFLGYFVPAELYATPTYEASTCFYGPRIAAWLYDQFETLMTREASEEGPPEGRRVFEAASVETRAGVQWVTLEGSPYAMGYRRGAAFAETIRAAYRERVVQQTDLALVAPDTGLWPYVARYLNAAPVAVPALAIGMRPRLNGVAASVFEEIEGLADGAGLPFDALWLLQCATPRLGSEQHEDEASTTLGTVFAAVGDRAGADDLLVGFAFDGPEMDTPVVLDVRPDKGHHFVEIGYPCDAGAFAGMNDAGVVVCALRTAPLDDAPFAELKLGELLAGEAKKEAPNVGPPVALAVRAALEEADGPKGAVARLEATPHLHGYHVLVAAPGAGDRPVYARVLEFGETVVVREPVDGFLLGVDCESPGVDAAAKARHTRAAGLLAEERIIAPIEMAEALRDQALGQPDRARILNTQTRYAVVFEPARGRLRVAFPDESGQLGEFHEVSLGKPAGRGSP